MTSIAANLAVSTTWPSLASASATSGATAAPTLTRDRAFTTFAGAILAALGTSSTTSSSGASGSSTGGSGGRVGDVALALKNALENPSATGDVVGGLITTVQSALAQATKTLSDAGYSRDQIQSLATQFSNALSDRLDVLANQAAAAAPPAAVTTSPATASPTPATPVTTTAATPAATPVATATTPAATPAVASSSPSPSSPSAATATTSSGAFEAAYRQTESGSFVLQTTQGDIVQINFRNSTGGSVTGVSANAAAGLAAYAAVGSYASTRFSVSVQGNLNADEVKAINAVLGQVDTLATQFFSGNLAQAFASAASLGADPKEIAGFALHLSESTALSLASVGDGGPAPASAAPAAPDPSVAAPVTAPALAAPVTVSADPTGGTTTPLAPSSTGGGVSSLLDYLQQVFDTLGATTTSGTVTFSAKAKIELLASAVSAASITPQESAAASLLKSVAAATTDSGPPAAAPAASTGATASA